MKYRSTSFKDKNHYVAWAHVLKNLHYCPYRNSVNIVILFLNVFYDKILDQNFAHTYNKTPPNIQLHI